MSDWMSKARRDGTDGQLDASQVAVLEAVTRVMRRVGAVEAS